MNLELPARVTAQNTKLTFINIFQFLPTNYILHAFDTYEQNIQQRILGIPTKNNHAQLSRL